VTIPAKTLAALLFMACVGPALAADGSAVLRGKYLYDAADCAGCHGGGPTAGPPAGGRALTTPFGTFHPPNISADPQNGIGTWSEAQFREALRHGVAPGPKQLFPVFPFPSFSGLTDQDIGDIRAYILSLPPAPDPSKPHDLRPPFGWRPLMLAWRALFFKPGPLAPDPARDDEWNRGRYLVQAVAHCGECHTPRNFMGALKTSKAFSGNIGGPDGQNAPNITSDVETGIGGWSVDEIAHLLKTGETPDFDSLASGMAEVIRGTRRLTDADRHAMAVYLKSIPPVRTARKPPKPA
jgi:mono/diheme cytochrome c family protein